MSLVFDSGALLAYLNAETGGDLVRDFLDDADVEKHARGQPMRSVLSCCL